jgi:hypothetical protein
MRHGIEGNQHLKAVTPFGQVDRAIPVPRRPACSLPLALALRRDARTEDRRTSRSAGRTDRDDETYKVFHGDGRALKLWGFAERNGATAECIVVVDGTPL